jgi:hypothetical protein
MTMELARTFVSFSSADIDYYHVMEMWNANEHIDFRFANFQVDERINSLNPSYIKSVLRNKIRRADTFVLLIGNDTFTKTEFVQSEVEVAIEKGCRLIGMNINNTRFKDWLCPSFFAYRGGLFIPFSSRIAAEALRPWKRAPPESNLTSGDWRFYDSDYVRLGYSLVGDTAILPPPPNPFLFGKPPWAK